MAVCAESDSLIVIELETTYFQNELETKCGPLPNIMAALPHMGGALCSAPQGLANAQYLTAVQ